MRGNGLRIHFAALQSALINHLKAPNRHGVGKNVGLEVGLAEMILELIKENPDEKMSDIAEELKVTKRTVEREIKKLREAGRIERVGGKRYGHWRVNK